MNLTLILNNTEPFETTSMPTSRRSGLVLTCSDAQNVQWWIEMSSDERLFGAVHKVRHAIFGQFLPAPPVTLRHTSRPPPKVRHTSRTPRFLEGLVQKSRTKVPCTNSISIVRGGFCPGVLSGFSFCPFPLLSQYICYNRKLNITLNFMFHMNDKNLYKHDVTISWPPSPCHKLSHLLGPPHPPRAWRTLWTVPKWIHYSCRKSLICIKISPKSMETPIQN